MPFYAIALGKEAAGGEGSGGSYGDLLDLSVVSRAWSRLRGMTPEFDATGPELQQESPAVALKTKIPLSRYFL